MSTLYPDYYRGTANEYLVCTTCSQVVMKVRNDSLTNEELSKLDILDNHKERCADPIVRRKQKFNTNWRPRNG